MNYLDFGILALLILGIVSGVRKGLIISILNIVGLVVSIFLSFTFTKTFSNLVYKYSNIPKSVNNIVSDRVGSLDSFTKVIIDKLKVSGSTPQEFLTAGFINVATFIVLFIVITIIISFLKQGIRRNIKRSFFGPIDSILGGVLGFFKWILILSVIFAFVTPVLPMLSIGNDFYNLVNKSYLAKTFVNYNIITVFMKGLIGGSLKGMIKI